jgi:hypothetical protein
VVDGSGDGEKPDVDEPDADASGALAQGCCGERDGAEVLSREGNVAVVQLSGRAFPGVHCAHSWPGLPAGCMSG